MSNKHQLLQSLSNTQPRFDYYSTMGVSSFIRQNRHIILDAIKRCEMDVNEEHIVWVAEHLLVKLPNKPYGSYVHPIEIEDPLFAEFSFLGGKREKREG